MGEKKEGAEGAELQQPVTLSRDWSCEVGGGDDGRRDHMTFGRKPSLPLNSHHTHTQTGETGHPRWTRHRAGLE